MTITKPISETAMHSVYASEKEALISHRDMCNDRILLYAMLLAQYPGNEFLMQRARFWTDEKSAFRMALSELQTSY